MTAQVSVDELVASLAVARRTIHELELRLAQLQHCDDARCGLCAVCTCAVFGELPIDAVYWTGQRKPKPKPRGPIASAKLTS